MKKKILLTLFLMLSIFFFTGKTYAADAVGIGVVATNGSSLNIRKDASTTSNIVTKIGNKEYVTIIGSKNSFYYIEYSQNSYGYASMDYINNVSYSKKIVSTSGSSLNVRSGAATWYNVIKTIPNGSTVNVLSTSNGWAKILYDGSKIGYCSSTYLKSNTGVKLNVTSYKQFDTRWASSIVVGTKTMKQIGCLTTALAMTESYRTGTTITPLAMKNKSSYTSTGSIYWPSNYSFSTSSTNYLSTIKALLQQGKPVIIGANSYSGGQHWVVITGYTSDSLTTSSFTINDPGSSYRSTLNEFLASYPIFYKLAYYK